VKASPHFTWRRTWIGGAAALGVVLGAVAARAVREMR